MSTMVYKFRDGSRFRGDAEIVAIELERIRTEHGRLGSEDIVTEATPDAAPLHQFFEWSDAVAAHQQRLDQARRLVRALVIDRGDRPAVSMYVHVAQQSRSDGGYEPLATIVTKPDSYLQALAEARRDLDSANRRVSELLDIARTRKADKGDVARIMLAAQALATANEALHALH